MRDNVGMAIYLFKAIKGISPLIPLVGGAGDRRKKQCWDNLFKLEVEVRLMLKRQKEMHDKVKIFKYKNVESKINNEIACWLWFFKTLLHFEKFIFIIEKLEKKTKILGNSLKAQLTSNTSLS